MLIRANSCATFPLADSSVQCVVTSPPYWGLRDYHVDGQLGLEATVGEYVDKLVGVFREVWRVLRDDGVVWLNMGDLYAGSWGAQSRGSFTPGNLDGASDRETSLSARQIFAAPSRCPSSKIIRVKNSESKQARNRASDIEGAPHRVRRTEGTKRTAVVRDDFLKAKDLMGLPWRVAFALQAGGWWLRSDVISNKPNPMPESVTDRPTRSHEYLFLLSKSRRYYYDHEAIKEWPNGVARDQINSRAAMASTNRANRPDKQRGHLRRHAGFNERWDAKTVAEQSALTISLRGRNKRSVWTVAPEPCREAHFATFPEKLIEPCILAGSRPGDVVLDPFGGTGTVERVAVRYGRRALCMELSAEYLKIARVKNLEPRRAQLRLG